MKFVKSETLIIRVSYRALWSVVAKQTYALRFQLARSVGTISLVWRLPWHDLFLPQLLSFSQSILSCMSSHHSPFGMHNYYLLPQSLCCSYPWVTSALLCVHRPDQSRTQSHSHGPNRPGSGSGQGWLLPGRVLTVTSCFRLSRLSEK